ncbi:hypothetical protein [Flavobacterium aquiphilum]|uniref:hypothetical protein n=1 Tax=Flavobacterium aquiphilum TaxID=3003261 RepID=UPI00248052F1|nr:hypothetical protein [Flavobacterium aquiphilum]
MKAKFYTFYILGMVTLSCVHNPTNQTAVYNHADNIEELGQNYYYLGDANESQILLNLKPEKTLKFGKTIIPPEVIEYGFDDNYIIAKTKELIDGNKTFEYWIVDKRANNDSAKAMDSISFFKKTYDLDLKIKLKKRK